MLPASENLKLEMTVEELDRLIMQQNDILLLDVRNDKEFETWRIESRNTPNTLHIPYVAFVEEEDETARFVPQGQKVVVVCAKGGASDFVAEILRARDYEAVNLVGGMIAWGNYYAQRVIAETDQYQIYQIDRVARGCLSYVLISQGQAAVIDPARHIGQYQDLLTEKGVSLSMVLDTHAHADHISGGPALAQETGAPYYLHPYDGIHPFDMLPAKLDYEMLKDGQRFRLGDLTIQTLHVPGHTLGLVNFLVSASDGSTYLFSGDSIFINSFGRPDLGGQGQAWAPLVYEAIFDKIKDTVPSQSRVLPGHYARHSEANDDGTFVKTLDELWAQNPDLGVGKDEFIQYVLDHLPFLPPQYVQIKRVNAGLADPDDVEAGELELGKNICALSTAY